MTRLALPDGGSLWFEVAGEGPDVVLLHPGLWDSRTWDREFERLPAAGYRTTRYDLRGYGRSSRPSGEPYSHVDDLVRLLDRVGAPSAALVGCSMGGQVAIDACLAHPERVWALVAVAPGLAGLDWLPEEEAWWAPRDEEIDAAIEAGELERAQELRLGIWASMGTGDEAGGKIRSIAMDNLHEITMDESAALGLDPPAAGRLAEITAPVLVLQATHDPPEMGRICRTIADGVDGSRLIQVESDHVVNLRRPEEFERAVFPFLKEAQVGS